jgi:hypothetical protein
MGFSSGASSAKRKAQKAAAQQYLKEFRKLNPIEALPNLSAKNKREIEDTLGDETSFRLRNMAGKADRMARSINKDDDYKQKVSAYNDRYSILRGQMENKSSTRYTVSDKASVLPVKNTNAFGGFFSGGISGQQSSHNTMANVGAVSAKPNKSSFATQGGMYQNKEDAMADAAKKMDAYNNSLTNLLGKAKPNTNNGMMSYAPAGKYTQSDLDAMRISDPSRFIQEEKFSGFGVLYRNLNLAESAVNDISALGKNITNSTGNKNIEAYSALAAKLKPMVKQEAKNALMPIANQSLVAGDLAQSNYTETIS